MVKNQSKNHYVGEVIKQGGLPLPILDKIQHKFLFLKDYVIEERNFEILVNALADFIPNSLTKLVLDNNRLSD